ncbi:hypothetical protein LWI28_001478 [Acer negundo]|uniref:Uncharacterized protein n=1 Tax=Acer negundo TaxID=4023 RepID=A0AAD5JNW0_ACENE|nr:hypothetical protein LWI28_001478 [Acer negundo]
MLDIEEDVERVGFQLREISQEQDKEKSPTNLLQEVEEKKEEPPRLPQSTYPLCSHKEVPELLFYLHTLQWDPPIVDKAVIPVVCWTYVKIKKCVIWLHTEGGVESNQISVEDFFKLPTPLKGQYVGAAHRETSHANQGPIIGNDAHMKGIADVLQVVKEIQSTMKTEFADIRTKVNFLYDKFNSAEDKNQDNDLHNTSSHHNSIHNMPSNPSPPPQSSRPFSNPTSQPPTIEVSSNNTQTLLQHQQSISKSTPSWMKVPLSRH